MVVKKIDRGSLLDKLSGRDGRKGNIYNFILNNRFISAFSLNDSLLFIGESDRIWGWINSDSEKEVIELLKYAEGVVEFGWMGGIAEEVLLTKYRSEWLLRVEQYQLLSTVDIPELDLKVDALKRDDAEYIFSNSTYKDYTDINYIRTRIMNGESACIRIDNRLVAWGLTHDDGAMGFLHVMPEYRGKNLAKAVTSALIRKLRANDEPVFLQIEKSNEASLGLAQKFGFTYQCSLSWFKLFV